MDEAESGRVQCMELGCGRIVGERVVLKLQSGHSGSVSGGLSCIATGFIPTDPTDMIIDLDRYRQLLDRTYDDDNPTLKWCPHPNCEYAVQCSEAPPRKLDQIIPIIRCRCNRSFCFG